MTQVLDPLSAKMKFVESFTQQNKEIAPHDDDFLKPVKPKREIKIEIIEDGSTSHNRTMAVEDGTTLQELLKSTHLPESRRPRSAAETDDVPEWAKLAFASSNPNCNRKIRYY